MKKSTNARIKKVISFLILIAIVVSIANYLNRSPEEQFGDLRERITSVDSELRDSLKLKAIEALEMEGYNVRELVINAYNLDSVYHIKFKVLGIAPYAEELQIHSFDLVTEDLYALCILLRIGSDDGTVYSWKDECSTNRKYWTFYGFTPVQYVDLCHYYVDGNNIVMRYQLS